MELEKSTTIVIIIVAIGLILGIGLFVLGQFQTTVFTNSTATTTSNIVLTSSTDILDPLGVGITSSEVKANNNTWLEFDGVNDNVQVENDNNSGIYNNATATIWFNPMNWDDQDILFWAYGDGLVLRLDDNPRNVTMYYANTTTAQNYKTGNQTFNNNSWNFVAFTYSTNSTGQLYLNNVLSSVGVAITAPLDFSTTNTDRIGVVSNGNAQFYNGGIDEFRLYNSTLTESQLTEIYNSGRQANSSLPSDGLQVWYSFDESTGTTVHDKSGNGNNGV